VIQWTNSQQSPASLSRRTYSLAGVASVPQMVGSSFLEDISKEFTDSPDPFDFEATLLGEDVRMLFPDTLDVQMYGLDNVAALQVGQCHCVVTSAACM